MKFNILIVDDSILIQLKHSAIVEGLGHTPLVAGNGLHALELLTRQSVDLIIADLNMPVMDGYTFLREVRKNLEMSQIPIVVASTEAGASDMQRAYDAGADIYMVKPVAPEALKDQIRQLLVKEEK
jgi:two-component system chemotaxis response regulator CheY